MSPRELVQQRLGHVFTDEALLTEALTHTSYAHERGTPHNERLEFLGDAVLQLMMSAAIFSAFPKADEGKLSRARALLVNTHTLALIAVELGLDRALLLGRGEESSGGRTRERPLAAVTEAMLGALYLDAGHEAAQAAVSDWFGSRLEVLLRADDEQDDPFKDPRSRLQEHCQAVDGRAPHYALIGEEGPPHDPRFTIEVSHQGAVIGSGAGRSKQEAKKNAAAAALRTLAP